MVRLPQELRGRSHLGQPAAVEDHHAIREAGGDREVVGDEQLGVIVFGLVWLLEPKAMRRQADPLGERPRQAMDDEPPTEQERDHAYNAPGQR